MVMTRDSVDLHDYNCTVSNENILYSHDSSLIASTDMHLYLWDAQTGRMLKKLEGSAFTMTCCNFHPGGQLIAGGRRGADSGEGSLAVWDLNTGLVVSQFDGHYVTCCSYSPDGAVLASGEWGSDEIGSEIFLWAPSPSGNALGEGLVRRLKGHKDVVTGLCFSEDGSMLVSCSWDRQAIWWDPRTGDVVKIFTGVHTAWMQSVTLSRDASILATSALDAQVVLWSVATGQQLRRLQEGRTANVTSLSFSPDGRLLAAAAEEDRTAVLYDVKTGALVATLENGHQASCTR
jgi:WD40 repeat protein